MAERSSSLACKKFSANVFDKNKCQNCFKPKDTHTDASSPTSPCRPTSLEVGAKLSKTTVKSGSLHIATQVATLPKIQVQRWDKVWFMLYSSGVLEWFSNEFTKISLGSISLDDCVGLTSAEVDTNEPFSIGIKTSSKTHFLRAENRLEMDNWCRVLKPFVIASPGYRFNKMSPTTRMVGSHDTTISSMTNLAPETKSSVSRTASAPWLVSAGERNGSDANATNGTKKRWSANEDLLVKEEESDETTKSYSKSAQDIKKSNQKQVETDPAHQPHFSDINTASGAETIDQKGNEKTLALTLESELIEATRIAKRSQGKAEMYSKNLAEAKQQLEKANNVISIQKVNIEALTGEVESLKLRLKYSDEVVDKRLKELDNVYPTCNGSTSRDSIESGFIKLQSKLQENEKALIRRTRELEKANESRKKVAKHTRALLLELEEKLTENNRRINDLEEQLMNRTLDLQYEKEERLRIEREKGQLVKDLSNSNSQSKQREITKRSAELLQQAKEDHRLSKNEQKSQLEIESLSKQLEGKTLEIEKLQERLGCVDEKDGKVRKLETEFKKSHELVDALKNELKLVKQSFSKEQVKCCHLKNNVEEISVQVQEKERELEEMRKQNTELESQIEQTRKDREEQVLLLRDENEITRARLHEVLGELDALHADTRNPDKFDELLRQFEDLKLKSQRSENDLNELRDLQTETNRDCSKEKNKRLKLEKDVEERNTELRNAQEQVEKLKELLKTTQKSVTSEIERVGQFQEQCKHAEEENEQLVASNAIELDKLQKKMEFYQNEMDLIKEKCCERDNEVLDLKNELEKRMKVEKEVLSQIEMAEVSLSDIDFSSSTIDCERDKTGLADAMEYLSQKMEYLKSLYKAEKTKLVSLEQSVQTTEISTRRCSICEKRKSDHSNLVRELEETRASHQKEMDILQESLKNEAQTLKTQAEETKLKLTSKVILLQSDISELKAKHERELNQIHEQHKVEVNSWREKHEQELTQAKESLQEKQRELDQLKVLHHQDLKVWREKCDALSDSGSEELRSLRDKIENLESQLLSERESNERRIEALKKDYKAKTPVLDNGVVSLQEFEQAKELHSKELREVKENHRKELEENKSDMMMVLQALKSDSYQSTSMSNESREMNDDLKKLERYVETLKKDHAQEIEKLNQEHEQDLEQLRSDMVTLLRVQETYKTPDEGKADSNGNIVDLDGQLEALKRSHDKEMRAREAEHQKEVDQLKSDMLVAIQAASAVGSGSSSTQASRSNADERVTELKQHIEKLERDFQEERENFQNTIKKAESATKFGLRRNEEMSNKIYQMQREMEEIDTKYQKEVKLYKEAFDQEKNRKTTIGAVPGILAENESLKVKLQELELTMEQRQMRYDNEMKRYKEKFQQDNVLTVEELQLKIKSLEDGIEQMRIEHETEVERYTKAVKRGKVSLSSTVKERDLERKIDDLESNVAVMRQKHREEVRRYRERLEDEMERHRKEVSESRAKLRKLEADTRQMEDLKSKVTDLENKTSKLTKEASKCKEQELELADLKSKNRELLRQVRTDIYAQASANVDIKVDNLKRKLDKLEEAAEDTKRTSSEAQLTTARAKLSRYSSCDSIGLHSTTRTKTHPVGERSEDDIFEMNNNAGKSEIGGYKLNPGPKRPASVSAFPVQHENVSKRTPYNEKRRDSGSTSNRSAYQHSYLKGSTSVSNSK